MDLCASEGYVWDGVKRDRLVWIGDLYPEMRAAHCLFGDVPETLNSIDFSMGETELPNWMAGMPAYSLWWLIILRDEYAVNGDKTRFVKYLPYIKGLLKQIDAHIAPDGKTAALAVLSLQRLASAFPRLLLYISSRFSLIRFFP